MRTAPVKATAPRRRTEKTYWSKDETACLAEILRAYREEGGIGQTVRHYYYKLLSAGAIRLLTRDKSADNAYKFVSRLLTDARLRELLPWSAVVDPGRRSFTHFSYSSLAVYIATESRSGYIIDVWRGQPSRLEIWVEKDAMAEFVNGVARQYRVPVHVAKGYGSTTVIKKAADRYGTGRGWVVLYAGDFDPSGLDIERNLRDTWRGHGARPQIHRVALTQDDTARLPAEAALDLKIGDSRTQQFVRDFGPDQKGYELDAMPAGQLRRQIDEAIQSYMNLDALDEAGSIEHAVRTKVTATLRDALRDMEGTIAEAGLPESGASREAIDRYLFPQDDDDEDGG
jgi:hypothetical protein